LWRIFLGISGATTPPKLPLTNLLSILTCLFALRPRYLVLLYQLKAYNLKITIKVTKMSYMARRRTSAEACMGTPDEEDFCPPIYPVRHILSMRREHF
jgi:hypothetical protein